MKLYGPFDTAADLPVGTWFLPQLAGDDLPDGAPVIAYREEKQAVLLFTEGAARHALRLVDVGVRAVLGMPSQTGVPMCTLPLAEWLEWAWVRFDGITGEACLSHLKKEVQELDEAVTELNRATASSSDFKVYGYIDEVAEEASDVIALALHTAIRLVGTNLPPAMRRKLAVNRERDWQPRADGSLRHVESKAWRIGIAHPEKCDCGLEPGDTLSSHIHHTQEVAAEGVLTDWICGDPPTPGGASVLRDEMLEHGSPIVTVGVWDGSAVIPHTLRAFDVDDDGAEIDITERRAVAPLAVAQTVPAALRPEAQVAHLESLLADVLAVMDEACTTLGIPVTAEPATSKLERIVRIARLAREWRKAGEEFAVAMLSALGMDDGSGMPLKDDFGPEHLAKLAQDCARVARERTVAADSDDERLRNAQDEVRRLRRENGELKSAKRVLTQAAEAMDKILYALREDGEDPQTMAEWVERFTAAPGSSWGDRLTPDQHAERIIAKISDAKDQARRLTDTVGWAAVHLGASAALEDGVTPDINLERVVHLVKQHADEVTQQYAEMKSKLAEGLGLDARQTFMEIVEQAPQVGAWSKAMVRVVDETGLDCYRQDPSVCADRVLAQLKEKDDEVTRLRKAYDEQRGRASAYQQRSEVLAAIEGFLGGGADEPIKTVVEAQQKMRHHVGDAVIASLASAVGASEQTLASIRFTASRLLKYGRYRARCGEPVVSGQAVATPAGDALLVERVFLVDEQGEETDTLANGLTWAASGPVLTGFGGARSVVVSGPLTILGWR